MSAQPLQDALKREDPTSINRENPIENRAAIYGIELFVGKQGKQVYLQGNEEQRMRRFHKIKIGIGIVFCFCLVLFNVEGNTETQKEWEASIKVPLTEYWEEDLVAVARTQIGYEESKTNFIRSSYGKKGYTRYGDWYGYDYMDWCVSFVSFCAHYAGIPLNLKAGNINGLINAGKKYHSYHLAKDHERNRQIL